ncbi:hypothetical protein BP5796_01061 [Coleophoma crateriformis]|uniref:AB hydrolase-1 domain-containing protein n=1 Tax=Coleophoma crateriformis TaxID=565419 RepID=A0A3D8TCD8_9HELO|nr:hypothetical protein BP5796_01061 [Coleophoma crateriformis]
MAPSFLQTATDWIRRSLKDAPRPLLISAGILASISLGVVQYQWAESISRRQRQPRIARSPLKDITSTLTEAEKSELPYPPDLFPGARDVDSPYGSLRVYEWGPEDGRKVLLIHGVTTPSIVLYKLAHILVERGCRVMLPDLWGRGYSDNPSDLPQDSRLFATQILLAITSSPLAWTGSSKFDIVGYSMGGGVVAAFAAYFPNLLSSVVLMGPVGLIRDHRIVAVRRLPRLAAYFPDWMVERAGRRFMQGLPEHGWPSLRVEGRPDVTERSVIRWLTNNHAGFTKAWTDSMFQCPAWGAETRRAWEKLGQTMLARKGGDEYDKVLVILGETDSVIVKEEFIEDALEVLGEQNVDICLLTGDHDFGFVQAEEAADTMFTFWSRKA